MPKSLNRPARVWIKRSAFVLLGTGGACAGDAPGSPAGCQPASAAPPGSRASAGQRTSSSGGSWLVHLPLSDTPEENSFKKKRAIFSTENLSTPLRNTSICSNADNTSFTSFS